jgi:hypothetical protein
MAYRDPGAVRQCFLRQIALKSELANGATKGDAR